MKRIVFYLTVAFLSVFCFAKAQGQGVSLFGATRAQDTSKTKAQLVVVPLANSEAGKVLTTDATGHFILVDDAGGDSTIYATQYQLDTAKVNIRGEIDSVKRQNRILGTLYSATTWGDLSDFDTNFNGVTIDAGGNLTISGGTRDSATVLSWDYTTCLTSWRMVSKFIVGEKSATSYGLAHGIKGKDSYVGASNEGWSTFATVNLTTNATQGGKIYILGGRNTSITTIDSSTSKLTFSVGDTVVLNTKWEYTRYTVSATNITNGSTLQHTYDFNTTVRYNTGKFSIWSRGGSVTLDSLNISSEAVKDVDIIFIGDSKFSCIDATSISKCPTRIVQMHYPNSNIHAGIGDQVNDVMDALPEIRSLNPKQALINLYYNDLWTAPASELIAQYPVMVDSIEAMGTVTYKMTPQDYPTDSDPDIQQRYDSFRTWLYDTYDSSEIIDAFFDMQKCGTPCNFNGAHPTDSGYAIIADKIINSKVLTGATEVHELIQRIINDSVNVVKSIIDDSAAAIRADMPTVTTPTLNQVLTAGATSTLAINTGKVTATVTADNTAPTALKLNNAGAGVSTGSALEFPFGQKIVGQFVPVGITYYDKNGTDNFYVSSSEMTYSKSVTIKTTLSGGRLTLSSEVGASADVYIKSANGLTVNTFVTGPGFVDRFRIFNTGFTWIGSTAGTATSQLDLSAANGYAQFRLRTSYTPTSTADANGNTGDVAWDADYIYIKTAAGWKRAALTTW